MNEHLFLGDSTYPHTEFAERVKEKLTEKFEHELINGKSKVAPSGFIQETYPHESKAADYLRNKFGANWGNFAWRDIEAGFNAGMKESADRIEQLERELAETQSDLTNLINACSEHGVSRYIRDTIISIQEWKA